jgi:hypothetical protein
MKICVLTQRICILQTPLFSICVGTSRAFPYVLIILFVCKFYCDYFHKYGEHSCVLSEHTKLTIGADVFKLQKEIRTWRTNNRGMKAILGLFLILVIVTMGTVTIVSTKTYAQSN